MKAATHLILTAAIIILTVCAPGIHKPIADVITVKTCSLSTIGLLYQYQDKGGFSFQ